jgi:hypothetical protein
MARRQERAVLEDCRHHGEVPGGDDADTLLARSQIDLSVVRLGQPG